MCLVLWAPLLGQTVVADSGTTEVRFEGMRAGVFHPDMLTSDNMHWVSDSIRPILDPRKDKGPRRNIYAPSVLYKDGKWTIYYGGWDGIVEGNDKIYRTTTTDFQQFGDRHVVIENGGYEHVCNVNAQDIDGHHLLTCTVYPDENGRNKPISIVLNPGNTTETKIATPDDLVDIKGYPKFPDADVNGMSVTLYDEGIFRMYFCDFKRWGRINHAEGKTPDQLRYTGVATSAPLAVNDVKIMRGADGSKKYLMGLHMNHSKVYASVSDDPTSFPTPRAIVESDGDDDKYIVAVGWIVEPGPDGDTLLGMLYGAGAVSVLDQNRIFAKWLQRRPVPYDVQGKELQAEYRAEGPDVVYARAVSGEVKEWKVPSTGERSP